MASTLIDHSNLDSFFHQAVRDAAAASGYDPDAPSALYVAGVLADYARPGEVHREALERPLTLLLAEALETAGPTRFTRLRGLGDHVLYVSGFFADHLESRGVERRFVRSVGATAYDAASAMLRRAGGEVNGPDVFVELSTNFDALAALLGQVADALFAASARAPSDVVDLYARWVRNGSPALADALVRSGIVPTRGSGTLH